MDSAPIRVLLVDDEALARSALRLLLAKDPEVEVVGEAGSAADAIAKIRALSPDLLFLDIQLSPKKTGFDVLGEIDEASRPAVIFVTAYDNHALRAFDVHALDYLLKPFDDDRFARALERAKAHLRARRAHDLARQLVAAIGGARSPRPQEPRTSPPPPPSAPPPRAQGRIAIKGGGRVSFLPVQEIDWIEAEDYYVEVHAGGASHLLRESMRDMEAQLDPQKFVRIHRSTIVNIERVKELRSLLNGEYAVVLADGTELKCSRSRRDQICALLGLG